MKSGNLNLLEPSGPLQACNGTALSFYVFSVSPLAHALFRPNPSKQRLPIFLVFKWPLSITSPSTILFCSPQFPSFSAQVNWSTRQVNSPCWTVISRTLWFSVATATVTSTFAFTSPCALPVHLSVTIESYVKVLTWWLSQVFCF